MTLPPEPPPERELPPTERELPPTEPATTEPATTEPAPARHARGRAPFTRIRAAWLGVWAGIVVILLLIIFIGQNTDPIEVHFLWLDGQMPTALALLLAGVGGAVIALAVGAARILQLRRALSRKP
jgi:uncharacterized integral membrane protein